MSSLDALARRVRRAMANEYDISLADKTRAISTPRPWLSRDGLRIPRAADVGRLEWELRFLELLLDAYGLSAAGVQVVRVPTALRQVEHANGVRSQARYGLYTRMLAAGEPVPPILVERRGGRWFIWDGNHRTHAAREVGVPFLVGLTRRPVQDILARGGRP